MLAFSIITRSRSQFIFQRVKDIHAVVLLSLGNKETLDLSASNLRFDNDRPPRGSPGVSTSVALVRDENKTRT